MTRYQLACDKRITLLAILLEAAMVVACVFLADAVAETIFHIPTMMASHVSMTTALIAVGMLQYLIVATELIARHRDAHCGFTLPLVFIPGGLILRTFLVTGCNLAVITLKLLVYFVSVLLAFAFQILRVNKHLGSARLVDLTDRLLEPVEIAANRLYNALYFNKIRANTSVFTAVFNGSLSLWCINH